MCQDPLTTVLRSLDLPCNSLLGYEDVAGWPAGAREALAAVGLLRQADHARSVVCEGCGEGCVEEVEFTGGDDGEPQRAYVVCHGEAEVGRVRVELDRLHRWAADVPGLAEQLARELRASQPVEECVAERLWWLGRPALQGRRADVFLALGATWSDAGETFGSIGRLGECTRPLVFVPSAVPTDKPFGPSAQVLSLARLLSIEEGVLHLDVSEIGNVVKSGRTKRVQEVVPFATPPGTAWQQVAIQFVDDETVVVSAGSVQAPRTYQDLGFADGRTGEPDKLWKLLQYMALKDGALSWDDRLSHDDITARKKHVSVIRGRLKSLFGIHSDPIPYSHPRHAYEAEFTLLDRRRRPR